MSDSQTPYLATKVFVHKWPKDTPGWDESTQQELNELFNKNPEKIPIAIKDKSILIGNVEFYSLKKIGISVPFFKEECAMIFEAKFGNLFAHVHVHIKSKDFVEIFNQMMSWKAKNFPE